MGPRTRVETYLNIVVGLALFYYVRRALISFYKGDKVRYCTVSI